MFSCDFRWNHNPQVENQGFKYFKWGKILAWKVDTLKKNLKLTIN